MTGMGGPARQALAARAVEQGDAAGARAALYHDDGLSPAFDAATRVALGVWTELVMKFARSGAAR